MLLTFLCIYAHLFWKCGDVSAACYHYFQCIYINYSALRAVCYPHSRCTYILRVVSVVAVCYPHFVCTYTMVYVTLTFSIL